MDMRFRGSKGNLSWPQNLSNIFFPIFPVCFHCLIFTQSQAIVSGAVHPTICRTILPGCERLARWYDHEKVAAFKNRGFYETNKDEECETQCSRLHMRGAMLLLTTSLPQLHHQVRTTNVRIYAPALNACLLSCMVSPSLLFPYITHARVLAGIWTVSSIAIFLIGFGKSEMNMNTKIRLNPRNFLLYPLISLKGWCVCVCVVCDTSENIIDLP